MIKHSRAEEITLVYSQCSQSTNEDHSDVYRAVIKGLHPQPCPLHQQKCHYYYDSKLLCQICFHNRVLERRGVIHDDLKRKYTQYFQLQHILNHPIVLAMNEFELMKYPIELMEVCFSSCKQIFKKNSDFTAQRQMIESFVSDIKDKIGQFCDQILTQYTKVENHMQKHQEIRDKMVSLNTMYEQPFMEMLADKFKKGTKSELQNIFQQFSNHSENPFSVIMQNLQTLVKLIQSTPFLNTGLMQQIYTHVTDQQLWKTKNIVMTLQQSKKNKYQGTEMILYQDQIKLQSQYGLTINQGELNLFKQGKKISSLPIFVDSVYRLPGYKILGVTYEKLMVINYFDTLQLEQQIQIPGCTDILTFPYHLIAVSNNNLIKICLKTKEYEILGRGYKNLKYEEPNSLNFICQNDRDEVVTWNCYTQFMTPVT